MAAHENLRRARRCPAQHPQQDLIHPRFDRVTTGPRPPARRRQLGDLPLDLRKGVAAGGPKRVGAHTNSDAKHLIRQQSGEGNDARLAASDGDAGGRIMSRQISRDLIVIPTGRQHVGREHGGLDQSVFGTEWQQIDKMNTGVLGHPKIHQNGGLRIKNRLVHAHLPAGEMLQQRAGRRRRRPAVKHLGGVKLAAVGQLHAVAAGLARGGGDVSAEVTHRRHGRPQMVFKASRGNRPIPKPVTGEKRLAPVVDHRPRPPSGLRQGARQGQIVAAIVPIAPDMVRARVARIDHRHRPVFAGRQMVGQGQTGTAAADHGRRQRG